jgi:delta-aminolevulinic acid dehydratase/porphobilinogen synthase
MVTTKEQRKAMRRIYMRTVTESESTLTYRQWRRTVQQGYDCLMVKFAGMWLGIESDGYTHS